MKKQYFTDIGRPDVNSVKRRAYKTAGEGGPPRVRLKGLAGPRSVVSVDVGWAQKRPCFGVRAYAAPAREWYAWKNRQKTGTPSIEQRSGQVPARFQPVRIS